MQTNCCKTAALASPVRSQGVIHRAVYCLQRLLVSMWFEGRQESQRDLSYYWSHWSSWRRRRCLSPCSKGSYILQFRWLSFHRGGNLLRCKPIHLNLEAFILAVMSLRIEPAPLWFCCMCWWGRPISERGDSSRVEGFVLIVKTECRVGVRGGHLSTAVDDVML